MIFKLSYLNSNLALTLGYLNPSLNNSDSYFVPAFSFIGLNLFSTNYINKKEKKGKV